MTRLGTPILHDSAVGHVTGSACFTDDLCHRLPGLLTAWPVTSPHARARVVRIDAAAALAVPGVVRVLTADDVAGVNDIGPARRDEPLFPTEASFHGHAIAWVLADSEDAAREGAKAVGVEWEPLPALLDLDHAVAADAFHTEALSIVRGDVAAALAAAPRQLTGRLEIPGQEHFALETQVAIATFAPEGSIHLYSSTQHPSETQEIVARVLGRRRHEVVVECLRMGGAFGVKEVQANAWAAVAALGLALTGRPTRVRLDRLHDMILTGKRHAFRADWAVGFDQEGRLLGVDIDLVSDGGWCLDLSRPVLQRALFHVDNAYFVPQLAVRGRVAKTNRPSATAFRGFGGPQGMLVIEEILSRVARAVGRPPEQVRGLNLYRPGQSTHYGQQVTEADRLQRVWGELATSAAVEARRAELDQASRPGHLRRGLAMTPVKFGISFTHAPFNQAGALVLVYTDGSVAVAHGGTEMGQGLHSKIKAVAADALGVTREQVRIVATRTDKVPNTSATAASSGSDLNGAAVAAACAEIRERLARVAALELGVDPAALTFSGSRVNAPDGRSLAFEHVVHRAYEARTQLFATGYYRTPGIQFDVAAGRGTPFYYFSVGAAVAEVEVDGRTGSVRVLRVDILHDVGTSLAPNLDRGQIEGGFAQGMGWLLLEELVTDASGRLATRGASTYKLPTVDDMPSDLRVELLTDAHESRVIGGSKAVGEPPLMLAFCVREAIRDAVARFAPSPATAAVELAAPSTPEAVWRAVRSLTSA